MDGSWEVLELYLSCSLWGKCIGRILNSKCSIRIAWMHENAASLVIDVDLCTTYAYLVVFSAHLRQNLSRLKYSRVYRSSLAPCVGL